MLAQQRLAHGHGIKFADIGADRQAVDGRRADDATGRARPSGDSCKVRGIGVAVRVSTWTSVRSCFRRSLWPTPKCCSSSITSRPRFLNRMALASSAWVPITISTVPRLMPSRVACASLALTKRDSGPHLDREAAKPFGEAFVMLARQQRRRRDHRHLHARHGRDKGRAHRHLGLAKADIAANQPVHRRSAVHDRPAPRRWRAAGRRFPDRETAR